MVQNLNVSGKDYFPSAELAQRFGYTSDYLSRLAREGKIVATNVNRKWFIDEDSLKLFIQESNLGKEARSTELKKKRKIERLVYDQSLKQEKKQGPEKLQIALAQSTVVFMCMLVVGLLGWTVVDSNIGLQELGFGFEDSYRHIGEAVLPDTSMVKTFSANSIAAVFAAIDVQNIQKLDDLSGPNRGGENLVEFSDEVDLSFVADDQGIIRPVFKSQIDGQEYQMIVTPSSEGG